MGAKGAKPQKKNEAELLEEEITLLLSTTHFNRQQIQEWHANFVKDCPKGKLDKIKFKEFVKQFDPTGKADKYCGHVFRTFDRDNSGEIDFVEFLMGFSVTSQGDVREKLGMVYNMYDIDRNGKVSRKSMEKIIESILLGAEENLKVDIAPSELVNEIMFRLDLNCDGFLSSEEFIDGCMKNEVIRIILAPFVNV